MKKYERDDGREDGGREGWRQGGMEEGREENEASGRQRGREERGRLVLIIRWGGRGWTDQQRYERQEQSECPRLLCLTSLA